MNQPQMQNISYVSQKPHDKYIPMEIFNNEQDLYYSMPSYSAFEPYISLLSLAQRSRFITECFQDAVSIYKKWKSGERTEVLLLSSPLTILPANQLLPVTESTQYKFAIESILFHIRNILDVLAQIAVVTTNFDTFKRTDRINPDCIGHLAEGSEAYNLIHGNGIQYENDPGDFLGIANRLFNSFKHSHVHPSSHSLMGKNFPTIVSFSADKNNYNKIVEYHNHNAYEFMKGYQENILRIHRNFRTFQSQ